MDGEAHSRLCDRVVPWGAENIGHGRAERSDAGHYDGRSGLVVETLSSVLGSWLSPSGKSSYCYYMPPIHLKVARIGNSRGVRIPALTLERYRIGDSVVMEERAEGILLRPRRSAGPKLSWDDTARAMANASEDWSAWDETLSDGLDQIPWESPRAGRVAEKAGAYHAARKPKRPKK